MNKFSEQIQLVGNRSANLEVRRGSSANVCQGQGRLTLAQNNLAMKLRGAVVNHKSWSVYKKMGNFTGYVGHHSEGFLPLQHCFCRYLASLDERTESKFKMKNERLLFSLRRDRFGNALSDTTKHILNFSDYVLSHTESFVLSRVLNFG